MCSCHPPIDCFFVYATASRDSGMNSDLSPDSAETASVQKEFARFTRACRPFAPIYRQMTVGAVAAAATGVDVTVPARTAYSDVARAWRTYLARHNRGRPFVLVGHSQGSLMLQELIKRLDGAMERMPQDMPANNNPVGQQIGRIAKAFGRG